MNIRRVSLLVSVAAVLVFAVGGAAADTFTLTVIAQTNSTITFSYPAQSGYGYLYSANGVVVSQTNDPARSSVKFSKVPSNSYDVDVKVKGANGHCCATPPPPPPPPPSSVTMGETSVLANGDSGNGNLLVSQRATLAQTATLQSLSFYVTAASGNLRLGVYNAAGPSGGPGQKVAETASFAPVAGWNTKPVVSPVSLAAGTYWLAYLPSSDGLGFRKNEDSSSDGRYYSFAFGTLPSTFSTSPLSTPSHWSFYATLTPSGAPPPAPQCSDGADNDGDTKVDYPADPGCDSATDNDETDPPPPPPSGDFPNASNTGVPAGTTLTAYTGPSNITTANTVIDGKTMGCIDINAANVLIKNSKISCGGTDYYAVFVDNGSLTIQDSEIDCQNRSSNGEGGAFVTYIRVEISLCENGASPEHDFTIRDSYIHDLYEGGDAHGDGMQAENAAYNIFVIHNTIIGMGSNGDRATSAIISDLPTMHDWTIQGNLLSGGQYTLYCATGPDPGYSVRDNAFSLQYGVDGYSGHYGFATECGDDVQSGNYVYETGEQIFLQ